jgi:hypothetical protein
MHHEPGTPVPAEWEECEICEGAGCGWCDGTGKLHPRRAKYLGQGFINASVNVDELEKVLYGPFSGTPLGRQAFLAFGDLAREFLGGIRNEAAIERQGIS